jgi:hypothetical protein
VREFPHLGHVLAEHGNGRQLNRLGIPMEDARGYKMRSWRQAGTRITHLMSQDLAAAMQVKGRVRALEALMHEIFENMSQKEASPRVKWTSSSDDASIQAGLRGYKRRSE